MAGVETGSPVLANGQSAHAARRRTEVRAAVGLDRSVRIGVDSAAAVRGDAARRRLDHRQCEELCGQIP